MKSELKINGKKSGLILSEDEIISLAETVASPSSNIVITFNESTSEKTISIYNSDCSKLECFMQFKKEEDDEDRIEV